MSTERWHREEVSRAGEGWNINTRRETCGMCVAGSVNNWWSFPFISAWDVPYTNGSNTLSFFQLGFHRMSEKTFHGINLSRKWHQKNLSFLLFFIKELIFLQSNKGSLGLRTEIILIESKHWTHYGLWTGLPFLLYLLPIGGHRKHNRGELALMAVAIE